MRMAMLILILVASHLPSFVHSEDWATCEKAKIDGEEYCEKLFSGSEAVGPCQACYVAAYNACILPTGTTQLFVQCDPTPNASTRNTQQSPVIWNCGILAKACEIQCASLSGNESFKTACTAGCSSSTVVQQCSEDEVFYPADSLAACIDAANQTKSIVIANCNPSKFKKKLPGQGRNRRGVEVDACTENAETKFKFREAQCHGSFNPLTKQPQRR